MSLDKSQLKELVSDTLDEIGLYSKDAVNLLLGTCAQESAFGTYIRQLNNGPALGIFQMEPATYDDIVNNYLRYRYDLINEIETTCQCDLENNSEALEWNMKLAICMARIHYLRFKEGIPNTIEGYAKYWKENYNTEKGAGTEEEFIRNYKEYVL